MFSTQQSARLKKGTSSASVHPFAAESAVFDEDNLVSSCASPVPLMTLAEQAGLSELLADKIHIDAPLGSRPGRPTLPRNWPPHREYVRGPDCIDDVDLVRAVA